MKIKFEFVIGENLFEPAVRTCIEETVPPGEDTVAYLMDRVNEELARAEKVHGHIQS